MKFGCALIVRGKHATQETLRTMATQADVWGFDSLWASDHLIILLLTTARPPGSATGWTQHLNLASLPETIGNAFATMERFVRAGRPTVAPCLRHG